MNTSILAFVLLANALAPTWQNDYFQAQKQGADSKKPLAVVFGSGANGWTKVIRAESPSPEVTKLLADHYVRVYVDTATAEGRKIARQFDITGDTGLVISDRNGSSQAFWHQGDLTNVTLSQYLRKYADPELVVRHTETPYARTSYYPFGGISTRTIPAANC